MPVAQVEPNRSDAISVSLATALPPERSGNAGLFSTAADTARLAIMLANGGELHGSRYLKRSTVDAMLQVQPDAGRRTLGWTGLCPEEIPNTEGILGNRKCGRVTGVGHNGYTGTSLWSDPETKAWEPPAGPGR